MYKIASEKSQRRLDRGSVNVALAASQHIPDAERLLNLKAALGALDLEILACTDLAQRKVLGARKRAWADESAALKLKLHGVQKKPRNRNLSDFFVEAAKDRLPKHMIEMLFRDAKKLSDAGYEEDLKAGLIVASDARGASA